MERSGLYEKAERQRLIKQLIMQQDIETQDELITRLEELGVRATQATVSRDIREMSIVKTHGADGRVKYAIFLKHKAQAVKKNYENQ